MPKNNSMIYAAWFLYLVSLIMPWSDRPFSGWLGGWLWQLTDLFPFIHLITAQHAGAKEIASTLAITAGLNMWLSPLLLYALNRGAKHRYAYIPLFGFACACLAFGLKIYYMKNEFEPIQGLYIVGNLVWMASFMLLSAGFTQHLKSLKQNILRA